MVDARPFPAPLDGVPQPGTPPIVEEAGDDDRAGDAQISLHARERVQVVGRAEAHEGLIYPQPEQTIPRDGGC